MKQASPICAVRGSDALFPNDFGEDLLCRQQCLEMFLLVVAFELDVMV